MGALLLLLVLLVWPFLGLGIGFGLLFWAGVDRWQERRRLRRLTLAANVWREVPGWNARGKGARGPALPPAAPQDGREPR